MLAKRTSKNQITIPKEIVAQAGEVEYYDVFYRDGEIVLKPVEVRTRGEHLDRIRKKIDALGLKEDHIKSAVKWARQ